MEYVQNTKGNYYKFLGNSKLKKITEEEYLSKISNNLTNLDNLKKSLYPIQERSYILLKYPKTFPTNLRNKYIPADFEIANIIKVLWKNKIITLGWDQGFVHNKYSSPGFISVHYLTTDLKLFLTALSLALDV